MPDHTYGSLANCAGGITPWGTALSAEENWDDYAEDYGWGPEFAAENNGGYGWVLEVDPMDPDWGPRKHTNLGRLRHENATVWAREGKHLVAYTGDDARDKFLYRYVSDGRYHKASGRRNSRLFDDGQLWVAEFAPASQDETVLSGTGRWHEVEMSPAALVDPDTWVRAQPCFDPATFQLNRPEDAEIDPFDNSLYTTLTNNTDDPHGRIRRLASEGGDPTADSFTWSDVAVGGRMRRRSRASLPRQPGVRPARQPLDGHRHLLQRPQRPDQPVRLPPQQRHLHDPGRRAGRRPGVPVRLGAQRGRVTGPIWSPRQDTVFLAIQHPGEETSVKGASTARATYTSYWPRGNKTTGEHPSEPLPSVIAVRRS